MTSLEQLREAMPDFARDTRINLGTVISAAGHTDLSEAQVWGIALASAYATRNGEVVAALEGESAQAAGGDIREAAKAAATVMAMNNIYYRAIHLIGDDDISSMPARLRMNVIASPGIPKVDFELMSLAVSTLNGCGACLQAHHHELLKAGVSKGGIQSALRIASVVNAAAQARDIS